MSNNTHNQDNQKPSAQAMRVAEKLSHDYQIGAHSLVDGQIIFTQEDPTRLAQIIDREMNVGKLVADLQKQKRFVKDLCEDWAEIDDACDVAGCPCGDSYGRPTTTERVKWLHQQNKELSANLALAQLKIRQLKEDKALRGEEGK